MSENEKKSVQKNWICLLFLPNISIILWYNNERLKKVVMLFLKTSNNLLLTEQARLVSSLLYGTLFLIVKCTSGGLHLKNVRLLHSNFGKISIFLAPAGSFNVKNDNFHTFFSLSWL